MCCAKSVLCTMCTTRECMDRRTHVHIAPLLGRYRLAPQLWVASAICAMVGARVRANDGPFLRTVGTVGACLVAAAGNAHRKTLRTRARRCARAACAKFYAQAAGKHTKNDRCTPNGCHYVSVYAHRVARLRGALVPQSARVPQSAPWECSSLRNRPGETANMRHAYGVVAGPVPWMRTE